VGDSASRKQQRGNAGNDETSTHRAGKDTRRWCHSIGVETACYVVLSIFVARVGSLGVSAGAEQTCKKMHSLQKLACGGSARTETVMLSAEQCQYTLRIFSA